MRFTKMQGCGNDYVYIDGTGQDTSRLTPEVIQRLSDRHFGIGGDGVIVIERGRPGISDFEMVMYNADGSRAEMCGNGIRCVGAYVYNMGLTDRRDLLVESMGSVKSLTLYTDDSDRVNRVRVDMGEPILRAADIPVVIPGISPDARVMDHEMTVASRTWRMSAVSMGNPHAVILLPQGETPDALSLPDIGPLFERHAFFPKRVNTEFVSVMDRAHVRMRVWERGTGETLACGTGCCATAVACVLNGVTDRHVTVSVLGGEIECEWDEETGHVYMTGPATTVFDGEIDL